MNVIKEGMCVFVCLAATTHQKIKLLFVFGVTASDCELKV